MRKIGIIVCSLMLAMGLIGESIAAELIPGGDSEKATSVPATTSAIETDKKDDEVQIEATKLPEPPKDTAEPTNEPSAAPTAEVTVTPTNEPKATPSMEVIDPYNIEATHEVVLYQKAEGGWVELGVYTPSEEKGMPGSFTEIEPETEELKGEEEESEAREGSTICDYLKLDSSIRPISKLIITRNDEEQKTYVAALFGDKKVYVDINDVSNIDSLLEQYVADVSDESVQAALIENKANEGTKDEKNKISLPVLIALIEGGIIGIAGLVLLVLRLLANGNQVLVAQAVHTGIQETKEQIKSGNDSISNQISDLTAAVRRMPEALSGNISSKAGKKTETVDHLKVFLGTVNTLTKTSDPDWQKILADYNPTLVNYDQINGRFYEDTKDNEPSYAICSVSGVKYVIPSCYDELLRNSNLNRFFATIPSASGRVTGYKVDKPAKVETEGSHFTLTERGQITLLDN